MFCQFITTAEVLGWMLREMSVSFLYYFGSPSMGADQKREAIAKFKTESTIKVLVCSLFLIRDIGSCYAGHLPAIGRAGSQPDAGQSRHHYRCMVECYR